MMKKKPPQHLAPQVSAHPNSLTIPPMKDGIRLTLRQTENGGWILEVPGDRWGIMPNDIAAFSHTKDMLAGLSACLLTDAAPAP